MLRVYLQIAPLRNDGPITGHHSNFGGRFSIDV